MAGPFQEAEGILQGMKNKIWGLTKELPIRPNAFGEPQYAPRGVPLSIVNPFLTRPNKNDKIANKMIELDVDIPRLPTEITFNGVKLKLTTQQRSDFGVLVGRGMKEDVSRGIDHLPPMRDIIAEMYKDAEFRKAPPEIQKERIEFQFNVRRNAIKNYMIQTDPDLSSRYMSVIKNKEFSQ
jgi:hypothetical protein